MSNIVLTVDGVTVYTNAGSTPNPVPTPVPIPTPAPTSPFPGFKVVQKTMTWGAGWCTQVGKNGPGLDGKTILCLAFTVPGDFTRTKQGNFAVHEYGSPAISRTITLSLSPADFRLDNGTDYTGVTAPMSALYGSGNLYWQLNSQSSVNARLKAGMTYYLNCVNAAYYKGTLTTICKSGVCDIIIGQTNPDP